MTDAPTSASVDKDALMKLVTQQMVNALLTGDDDDEDDDAVISALQKKLKEREKMRKLKKKSRRKKEESRRPSQANMQMSPGNGSRASLEDLYYGHIDGSGLPAAPPVMPPTPMEQLVPGDELVVQLKDSDDNSFARGDLHELVDDSHRRSSFGSAEMLQSMDDGTKSTGASTSAGADGSMKSGGLSITELRQYVLDNIPKEVRDQIPESAWAQIFASESVDASKATPISAATPISQSQKPALPKAGMKMTRPPPAPVDSIDIGIEDDIDDDITIMSDVSGLTGAFPDGKSIERKRDYINKMAPPMSKLEEHSKDSHSTNTRQTDPPVAPGEESVSGRQSRRSQNSAGGRSRSRMADTGVQEPASFKKVRFAQVQIRYYERIVSDNPSVQSGAAIGIGWKYKRGGRVDVDYWEQSRGPNRSSAELVLPRHVRENILRDAGVSQKEMVEMVRQTLKVKNQRKQTVTNLPVQGLEETVEKARRRFTKIMTLGRKGG